MFGHFRSILSGTSHRFGIFFIDFHSKNSLIGVQQEIFGRFLPFFNQKPVFSAKYQTEKELDQCFTVLDRF